MGIQNRFRYVRFILASVVCFFGGNGMAQNIAQLPTSAPAQVTPATPKEKPEKGFLARSIKFSGSLRARWEATQGSDFSATTADSYLLTRARLGIAFQPIPWVRVFGEAQDAHALFYGVKPTGAVQNPIDFRQGYVQFGGIESKDSMFKAGRQELTLGSARMVDSGDWGNVTKTFEIVRGTIATHGVKADLIAGSVVLVDPNRMDRHKPGEHLYVSYLTFNSLLPNTSIEPYFMAKTQLNVKGKDGFLGNADTLASGVRVIGLLPGRVDYSIEAIHEGGGYADDTIGAWGDVTMAGWTISKQGWKPRLSADYSYAAGDSGRKDGSRGSFDSFYGTNPFFSLTQVFGWRNLKDLRAGTDFTPTKKLKFAIDYRNFWLATLDDGLYNGSNVRIVKNNKATSAHVGEGIDAQCLFAVTSTTTLGVGMGSLIPGAYLEQSHKTTGFAYPYLRLSRRF